MGTCNVKKRKFSRSELGSVNTHQHCEEDGEEDEDVENEVSVEFEMSDFDDGLVGRNIESDQKRNLDNDFCEPEEKLKIVSDDEECED